MAQARLKPMSVEEFLLWNLDQDQKYELVDGIPVPLRAMAGASNFHDVVTTNVIGLLFGQLQEGPCKPRTSDTAIRTSIRKARRADVIIDCGPPIAGSYEASNPVAVFEVLSPTTKRTDLVLKLEEYKRHPTLRCIVHIDPDVMSVVVFSRADGGAWDHVHIEQPDDVIAVTGTDAALPLRAVYDGIPLGRASAAFDG
jgi:Uma2 family endonuclease